MYFDLFSCIISKNAIFIESDFTLTKFNKKLTLAGLSTAALLFLSGCVQTELKDGIRVPTEAATHGLTYQILVKPMSSFVDLFAQNLHMGYGWGIILVTLIIRLFILPLGLNQAYKSTYMQEKMAYLQPVLKPINDRMAAAREAKDQAGMMAAQQALMQAQKDNGINMFASLGCLPLIIQWPFFIALYNAAAYTPGINSATFYGIQLGHPSVVLTILAGVFYAIQTLIMMHGMPEDQKKQQRTMLILSPAMIVVFSFMSPAGVTLYWVAGGLIIVIQQIIVTFVMKPYMKKKIDEEFKANPPKIVDLPKDVTNTSVQEQFKAVTSQPNATQRNNQARGGRNAGKQHHK